MPEVVLHQMRHHRFHHHLTTSFLGWYEDCVMCEELESDYAISLEYHYKEASAEIAEQARRRWDKAVSDKQSQEAV